MLSKLRPLIRRRWPTLRKVPGRPFESETGPNTWFGGEEIQGYDLTRAEACVLVRYWLRIHAWEKLKSEHDDGIEKANDAAGAEAEEHYRTLASLIGETTVEQLSREVEYELGAPVLYRVRRTAGNSWKPSEEQKLSLGVCPVCQSFEGVLAHDGEAWVYCESHRCMWNVDPVLVPREHPDYRYEQQMVLQYIAGFTILGQSHTPRELKRHR